MRHTEGLHALYSQISVFITFIATKAERSGGRNRTALIETFGCQGEG